MILTTPPIHPMLQRAIDLASEAHYGQKRNIVVEPYIMHPQRVAFAVSRVLPDNLDAIAAAWLHDTKEDCKWVKAYEVIRATNTEVNRIVDLLTHDKNESYVDYVARIAKDQVAREIKRADLLDNMSTIPMNGHPRWFKYINALTVLSNSGAKE